MEATLTPEERLEQVDQELEDLKQAFVEAVAKLRESPQIDDSISNRLKEISTRLGGLRNALRPEDFTKDQVVEQNDALWEIREALDDTNGDYDLDGLDRLLVGIERVRHVVRDALDEYVSGLQDNRSLIIRDMKEWLPGIPNRVIAELVGVDRRTLTRWTKEAGAPTSRLRLVARLIAILRHSWTPEGIIGWFLRGRVDLEGRRPVTLLDDPNWQEPLLDAARAGRSQYAT